MSIQKAKECYANQEFEEAIPFFEKHIAQNEYDAEATFHLAICYRRLNDHIRALQLLEKCCDFLPDNMDFVSERGVGKFHLNDKSGALEDMDLCVQSEPQNPYRYSCRAYIRSNMNDDLGAIEDYQKAVALDPQDAIALNNLGMLEEKLGKIAAAKKRFKKSDDLIGRDPEANQKAYMEKYKDVQASQVHPAGTQQSPSVSPVPSKQLSFKSYLDTIKYVMGSKDGRKEFFSFLKGKK